MEYLNIAPKVIPLKRDMSAKNGYKILNWWLRKNRDEINSVMSETMHNSIIYGTPFPRVMIEKEN